MSSGKKLPAVDRAGAAPTTSTPLPGTFLGLALDLRSDRLYDLVNDIPDVMDLRAIQPSAAIVKVMSVPDSRCVRVVTPDDLEEEELPFVALSELCLHSCPDISSIWIKCARTAGSGLVPHSRRLVQPVVNIYSIIGANILPCITWSSRSCGDARSCGVRFGRGHIRIASII